MIIPDYRIRITLRKRLPAPSSQPITGADGFVPSSLFQHLPAEIPKSTARRNATFNPAGKDYRLGPLRIDWVDFEDMENMKPLLGGKEKEVDGRTRPTASATFVPHQRTKSGSTNLPEGVVHIFRDKPSRSVPPPNASPEMVKAGSKEEQPDKLTLSVLAVPSWMTPSDFLAFVAPVADSLQHLRMIRDSAPNRSIVILKFREEAHAAEFAEEYNGKTFNVMEPETCHVVRVTSIQIEGDDIISQPISRASSEDASYELPTCPVCLERMDSAVTGLITVPCSHTFHCMCLSKWGDSRCPVCRYSQTLLTSHPGTSSTRSRPIPFGTSASTPALSTCADCASTTNLWICLVCGNIGCGRYGRAHAHAHYEATSHVYALELETQRVWDYAGDGYVHRLIQNRADGKIVELPSASMASGVGDGRGPSEKDALGAEKIEKIGIEYSYLLTSQLDSQREWYEEQADALRAEVEQMRMSVDAMKRAVEDDRTRQAEEIHLVQEEKQERATALEREKARAEKKAEKMSELARKLDKELKEERAVSEGLMKNLGKMKAKAEEAHVERQMVEARVKELEDQVRDVMFFLEAKTKIEEGDGVVAEAVGGSIEIPEASQRTNGKKKKGKK